MKNLKIGTFIVVVGLLLATSLLFVYARPLFAAAPRYGGTLRLSDYGEGASIGWPAKCYRLSV